MAQAYHVSALGLVNVGSALRIVSGQSVVAKRDGKPLSEKDGPFQLAVPGETRPEFNAMVLSRPDGTQVPFRARIEASQSSVRSSLGTTL